MLVVIYMMVNGLMVRNMVRDSIIGFKDLFIKVNSNKINKMVKV